MDESLREKLIKMRAKDERLREELAAVGELFEGCHSMTEAVHLENARELERMTAENGGGWRKYFLESGTFQSDRRV